MTFEHKLRALVAGMRYAADRCDEYAEYAERASSQTLSAIEQGKARAMRSDANALESLLNERDWTNGGAGVRRVNAE